jgi:hypothetical protein
MNMKHKVYHQRNIFLSNEELHVICIQQNQADAPLTENLCTCIISAGPLLSGYSALYPLLNKTPTVKLYQLLFNVLGKSPTFKMQM